MPLDVALHPMHVGGGRRGCGPRRVPRVPHLAEHVVRRRRAKGRARLPRRDHRAHVGGEGEEVAYQVDVAQDRLPRHWFLVHTHSRVFFFGDRYGQRGIMREYLYRACNDHGALAAEWGSHIRYIRPRRAP